MRRGIIRGATDQRAIRIEKINVLRRAGMLAYAERYEKTHFLNDAKLLPTGQEGSGCRPSHRDPGFRQTDICHMLDYSGTMQFALQKNKLVEKFDLFMKTVDMGDFVGIEGEIITTRTGEKTIDVSA